MMRDRWVWLAVAAAALWGCQNLASSHLGAILGPALIPAAGSAGEAQLREAEVSMGYIALAIRWPVRNAPGFKAALIPTSTNALVVTVTRGNTQVVQQTVTRPTSELQSEVNLAVPSGENYAIDVKAYREAEPAATSNPIAAGSASGLNVLNSKTTEALILLDALVYPAISALDRNVGKVGDDVRILGSNFDLGADAPTVKFNGTQAISVSVESSSSLVAKVPAGATSGGIVVTADGVPSVSSASFWVAKGVSISASKQSWDGGPNTDIRVLEGSTLQFAAQGDFALKAGVDPGSLGTSPGPTWKISTDAVGTLSAAGKFTPTAYTGTATVSADLAGLISNFYKVIPVQVQGVTLSPATASVGAVAGIKSVAYAAVNTLSDGSTNSAATYTVTDSASFSISGNTVSAKNSSSFGKGLVTATGLGQKAATASITLTAYEVTTLAGNGISETINAQGILAAFRDPLGIAINSNGLLFVADYGANCVRTIDSAANVRCPNVVGGESAGYYPNGNPKDVAADDSGTVYFLDYSRTTYRLSSAGIQTRLTGFSTASSGYANGPATMAGFGDLRGIAIDPDGNIYLSDEGNIHAIRLLTTAGVVSTLAGPQPPTGQSGFADGPADDARFKAPRGLAWHDGVVYVADSGNNRIRSIKDGVVQTFAGTGLAGFLDGNRLQAAFNNPNGVTVHSSGEVFVADDLGAKIRKIMPSGEVITVAGSVDGYKDGVGTKAQFYRPLDVAVDSTGNVYIADLANYRIRKAIPRP